jgi:hypothetical protein
VDAKFDKMIKKSVVIIKAVAELDNLTIVLNSSPNMINGNIKIIIDFKERLMANRISLIAVGMNVSNNRTATIMNNRMNGKCDTMEKLDNFCRSAFILPALFILTFHTDTVCIRKLNLS